MKVNRFVAMATLALLVAGTMAAFANRSYAMGSHLAAGLQKRGPAHAQAPTPVSPAISPACGPDQAQADGVEAASAAVETDNINLQCGDQSTVDVSSGSGTAETVGSAADTGPNVDQQVNDQSGDQTTPDTGVQAPESGN